MIKKVFNTVVFGQLLRICIVLGAALMLISCGDAQPTDSANRLEAYRIGSFNLRNFGPGRIEDPVVMLSLVSVLKRYDLALLMEIRDASGEAPSELLASLNVVADGAYDMVLSERLGRGNYKEQYGLLYRKDRATIHDYYTYDDGVEPYQDLFEREPLVAHVGLGALDFNLIGLHADPEGVALELNRLLPVYRDSVAASLDPDAVLLGDFNADCDYLSTDDFQYIQLRNDPDFVWLIDDDADTTSSSTDCAYDRIVVTRDLLLSQMIEAESHVYDFQSDLGLSDEAAFDVSNHYPVELEWLAYPR